MNISLNVTDDPRLSHIADLVREDIGRMIRKPFVLVVDDDPGIQSVMSQVLRAFEVEFLCVGTGKDAMLAVKDFGKIPILDLVFLDIWLPDGRDMTPFKVIREARPGIPIIVMTGYPPGDELMDMIKQNEELSILLRKPFGFHEILRALRQLKIPIRTDKEFPILSVNPPV